MAKKTSVRWVADPDLSSTHAAYVVAAGYACTDQKTVQVIVEPVTEINNRLLTASLDIGKFWEQLFSESVMDSGRQNACEIALTLAGCSELQLEQTAAAIGNRLGESRMAFQKRFPKLSDQLELRGRPIRDQWNAYGVGLLASTAKQIWDTSPPSDWWPSKVTGRLVQPMRGGDGGYDSEAQTFWIEAVLTDPDQTVPEILRVAWLVTQLAIVAHTKERSSESPMTLPWELGSVPLVLEAGKDLGIISGDSLPIETAMRLWGLGDAAIANVVSDWWSTRQDHPAPIPVRLKQLHELLEPVRAVQGRRLDTGLDLSEFDA